MLPTALARQRAYLPTRNIGISLNWSKTDHSRQTPSAWKKLKGKASSLSLRGKNSFESLKKVGGSTTTLASSLASASPTSLSLPALPCSPTPPVPEIPREYKQEAARAVTARAASRAREMAPPAAPQRLSPEPAGRAPPKKSGLRVAPPVAGSLAEQISSTPPSVNEQYAPKRTPKTVPWEDYRRPPPLSVAHGPSSRLLSAIPRHKGSAAHLKGASIPATPSGQSWPKGPEDPNWDDAVAKVRREMREEQEKERKEQKVAAKAQKKAVEKESDSRFKWAKKALQGLKERGDETGYDLKKAPGDMTEDDWQTVVQAFAGSNTTGLRDTYFQKRADPNNAVEAIKEAAAHHPKQMEKIRERYTALGLGITNQSPALPGTAVSDNINSPCGPSDTGVSSKSPALPGTPSGLGFSSKPPSLPGTAITAHAPNSLLRRHQTSLPPSRPLRVPPGHIRSDNTTASPRQPDYKLASPRNPDYKLVSPRNPDFTSASPRKRSHTIASSGSPQPYYPPFAPRPLAGHNAFADAENAGTPLTPRARRFHYPESRATPPPPFLQPVQEPTEPVPQLPPSSAKSAPIAPPAPSSPKPAPLPASDSTPRRNIERMTRGFNPEFNPRLSGTMSKDIKEYLADTLEHVPEMEEEDLEEHLQQNFTIAPDHPARTMVHPAFRGQAATPPVVSEKVNKCAGEKDGLKSDLPLRSAAPAIPPRNPERLQRRRATDPAQSQRAHLSVEIDDVITTWEAASPPGTPAPIAPPLACTTSSTSTSTLETQLLRSELGLPALRQRHQNEQKHPHHGLSWDTAKVMCRRVHNPCSTLPPPPPIPTGEKISMASLPAAHFRPAAPAPQAPKQCRDCGTWCCHYGSLMARAGAVTEGRDLLVEAGKARAQREIQELRVKRPMGVEEFETFLVCGVCEGEFCPGCVKLCAEQLCGESVCKGCLEASEFCGVHSMF